MYKDTPVKIVAIIQARMTSSRLPGKILMPLAGVPALQMMIERIQQSKYLDAICVATTTNATDDPTVALAQALGVAYFRGSEEDVLGRVVGAAQATGADIIVELTGDCPFMSSKLIDRGIEEFFSARYSFVSNTLVLTFPRGFDVQIFSTTLLVDVDTKTSDPIDRTHVSHYIYQHPEEYQLHNWEARDNERGYDLRVTLDEEKDYQLLSAVSEALWPKNRSFDVVDVVAFLRAHPDIAGLNKNVRQKKAEEL